MALFRPYDYQQEAMDWARDLDRFAFFLSPGMGKSVITATLMSERISEGRNRGFLIIAPLRVVTCVWGEQIAHWDHTRWMRVANLRTPEGIRAWEEGSADIYLINHELLPTITKNIKCRKCRGEGCGNCTDGFTEQKTLGFVDRYIAKRKTLPVDGIVWDELSLCKNHASVRVNSIRPYLFDVDLPSGRKFTSPFRTHIGLTGTPVAKDYRDLFAQVRLLDNGQRFGKFVTHFTRRYFDENKYSYSVTIKPGAKEEIDNKIADLALVMLGDDYLDVPTAATEDIEVELPAKARGIYEKLETELLVELETGEIAALSAAALTNKLLQITGGCAYSADGESHAIHDAKIDALKKLRKKLGPKEPLIVFVAYKHEYQRVLDAIPGSRMFDEKDLKDWQKGKIHTWVANPASMGYGLDGLQMSCKTAVWFTLTWSNERYLQSNARIIRTGQSYASTIYRILCKDTVDDAVVASLRWKDAEQTGLLHALRLLQKLRKAA
jgi:hypothetical protein